MLASHGEAPDGDDLMVAIDQEERCAAEERRQKRRQKRKERKRAVKAQVTAAATSTAGSGTSSHGSGSGRGGKGSMSGATKMKPTKAAVKASVGARASHGGVLVRRSDNAGETAAPVSVHRKRHVHSVDLPCQEGGCCDPEACSKSVKVEKDDAVTRSEEGVAHIRAGLTVGPGFPDAVSLGLIFPVSPEEGIKSFFYKHDVEYFMFCVKLWDKVGSLPDLTGPVGLSTLVE